MTSLAKFCCRVASLPATRTGKQRELYYGLPFKKGKCIFLQPRYLCSSASPNDAKEPPVEQSESDQSTAADDRLTELSQSNDKLTAQVKEVEEKYIRALAETENVRQRMKKQVDDAKQFGIQQFCKDLLTVADTLRLATDKIPVEQLENSVVKNMHDGLKLTESQLLQVFNKHGVDRCDPEGERFDPNLHEAVFQQPLPEKEPGTIFVVTKPGYTLNNRVLRPALVGVVKGP
ncbi:grpE protein homolog 1, mitochondrial-like [Watersipora subatra]|uniref:grpE protein homolog 1, mitochondrial-like n=1 Tax=Watersipora subatra TaxID=2589382 RepID=UPI00355BF611